MDRALYRAYRPTDFDQVVSQESIITTLQHELQHDRVAHAYLFSGPRGVGKTTMARLLAKEVNVKDITDKAQWERAAADILAGKSIDVIEIDAASHTGVDNVRENIIENARFTPQQLPYKVFIIDEVHMLSTSAFNALLKTLEEPPEHVIFVLATTEIHRVPDTIISRCQRFDFKRVAVPQLVQRLMYIAVAEKVTVDEAVLHTIARRADGSVRDAEVLFGQILSLGEKNITTEQAALVLPQSNIQSVVQLYLSIVAGKAADAIMVVHQLVTDGVQLQDFTAELIEFLRTLLLVQTNDISEDLDAYGFDTDIRTEIDASLQHYHGAAMVRMIETFIAAEKDLRYATIPQLPLELAIVTLTQGGADPTPSSTPIAPVSDPQPNTTQASPPAPPSAPPEKPQKVKKAEKKKEVANAASLETITESWQRILEVVDTQQRSVGMSLKVGVPYRIEDGRLVIAFQHAFHAERVAEITVRNTIQDAITTVTGQSLMVGTIVLEPRAYDAITPIPGDASSRDNVLQQAVEVFGGEVVEEEN